MSVAWGEVTGDDCPRCGDCANLEGEFHEGSEHECVHCGLTYVVTRIKTTHNVTLGFAFSEDKPPTAAKEPR